MSPAPQKPRLTKSPSPVLAGVCGGIAEFLGWQPRSVRVLWLGGTFLTGIAPGVLAYACLALVMPGPDEGAGVFRLEDHRTQ